MNNNPQQAALYQALSERVKPLLEPVFAQQPTIMDAYLQLVAEAIHCHYLHPPALQSHWHTLLEYWLVAVVPTQLAQCKQPLAVLAQVWNLGENIHQHDWLEPYLLSQCANLSRLDSLLDDLAAQLRALLDPPPYTARWQPPYSVQIINPRPLIDQFLPGALYFVTAQIIAVLDRRYPEQGLLLALPSSTQSALKPVLWQPARLPPPLKTSSDDLSLDIQVTGFPGYLVCQTATQSQPIMTPGLGPIEHALISPAGYIVLSVVDSQRLWVIHCDLM